MIIQAWAAGNERAVCLHMMGSLIANGPLLFILEAEGIRLDRPCLIVWCLGAILKPF